MTPELQQTETSLTISRTFDAPVEKVWEHFTDAKKLAAWYAPGPMRADVPVFEAREGGAFKVHMTGAMEPGGEESTHTAKGTIKKIEPKKRLVHTWAWESDEPGMAGESLVTVTFEDLDGKTKVTLVHEGLPDKEAVESHTQGWTGIFEKLPSVL